MKVEPTPAARSEYEKLNNIISHDLEGFDDVYGYNGFDEYDSSVGYGFGLNF